MFGGIPATGAIARTATNIKSGAKTPLSAMIHAIVLLLILLYLGGLANKIPLAALAGILIYIAYNMAELHTFKRMFKAPAGDAGVMIVTFILTIVMDLTIAIEVGILLSAFLFLKRMESATEVALVTQELTKEEESLGAQIEDVPEGVQVFVLEGPLFFGAIERFESSMNRIAEGGRLLILRMRNVPIIDSAGIYALITFHERLKIDGKQLLISGLRPQPLKALEKSGFFEVFPRENICSRTSDAIERARELLAKNTPLANFSDKI